MLWAVERINQRITAATAEVEAGAKHEDALARMILEICGEYEAYLAAHDAAHAALVEAAEAALALAGGWREAIAELEDWCAEPVRLKNMLAAIDQLDEWTTQLRAALDAVKGAQDGSN